MTDIFLIRHGEYVKADDDKDCILTDIGKKQAVATGGKLYQILKSDVTHPVFIYSSTLQRAKQTTHLILQNDCLKNLVKQVEYDENTEKLQ